MGDCYFLIFNDDSRQKIQSMISSKSKKGVAYAKICRDKSGSNLKVGSLGQKAKNVTGKKQNIYDELINHLDAEETDYINQLISKQNKKLRGVDPQISNGNPGAAFEDRSNSPKQPTSNRKIGKTNKEAEKNSEVTPQRDLLPLNSCLKNAGKSGVFRLTPEKQLSSDQSSFNSESTLRSQCFVNHLNDYITELKQQNDKSCRPTHHRRASNCRLPEDDSEDSKRKQEWGINPSKYNKVLNQLQQTLKANDVLQERVEFQERKISEMSKIMVKMCCEMDQLKKQLKNETEERQKYDWVFQDFVAKMSQAKSRSTSKNKNYPSGHAKRYSHIPSSHELEDDLRINPSEFKTFMEERKTFDGGFAGRSKEEGYMLKKKGIPLKKKMGDLWRESEIFESTVDRFKGNQRYF